eukprot:symbB.v1.2.035321.t1/scaffold4588.1/size37650/1
MFALPRSKVSKGFLDDTPCLWATHRPAVRHGFWNATERWTSMQPTGGSLRCRDARSKVQVFMAVSLQYNGKMTSNQILRSMKAA